MPKNKKKYKVTFYYHASTSIIVDAENEEQAVELARNEEYDIDDLLISLQEEDAEPDVEYLDPKNHIFR